MKNETAFVLIIGPDQVEYVFASSLEEAKAKATSKHGPIGQQVKHMTTREWAYMRYPNLIKFCQRVALLCQHEAVYCVTSYKNGWLHAGEAVNHYGGTQRVIEQAIKMRHSLNYP